MTETTTTGTPEPQARQSFAVSEVRTELERARAEMQERLETEQDERELEWTRCAHDLAAWGVQLADAATQIASGLGSVLLGRAVPRTPPMRKRIIRDEKGMIVALEEEPVGSEP